MSNDDNYDIYVNALNMIAKQTSLPVVPMTHQQFMRAQIEANFVHTSVIDMDAFEVAFGS